MLKWLLAGASSRQTACAAPTEIVTDDPLATICAHKVDRPLEIYAVSRVNPLFDEEDSKSQQQHGSPEFPDKSASSGYGSNRYNSSSESGAEEPTEPTTLSDGYTRRTSAVTLSPIPEGKVDHCVPRPVWPQSTAPSDRNSGKATENAHKSSQELLRELSNTIKQNATPEYTLRLESLQTNSSCEEVLRKLSVTLSNREPLTKMSRALSNSSSSNGGSLRARPSDERGTARTGRVSSSSSTSSSGFSDLTHTTPSSCSSQPPVFLHEHLSSVPNCVRNAMLCGTWGPGDVSFKSPYCPAPGRLDFTLDMPRAERLMLRIKAAKRRRCWCRLVTSLLGLAFFLMSVMVVSMLITRGKRVFGPI